jgi:cytoskeletal protein CcmA (bactofilin family)
MPEEAPPVLGEGMSFEGILVLHGRARIDGHLRGSIVGADVLHIGPSGSVQARIEAEEVVVAGTLEGDVIASRRLELEPTARVTGSVRTPSLVCAEGSVLEGPCKAGPG